MSSCKLDHSLADVLKKLEDQRAFLPTGLYEAISQYLDAKVNQAVLNEIFHLLKKYDLATNTIKEERNEKLRQIVQ
ncbi:group-specific protein [Bacillus sp. FJAT-50079]|uniref:group-specific protein n=1 Tax=Bacillus sp. FJAT-50079 TaxID=2833577 RepID=UPI001BC9F9D5|nr:group-specific protein [Bacillus sp. FJAT-50079]MBS4209377.1 group-specific protein [Bacillus sp. FJAT-50079]